MVEYITDGTMLDSIAEEWNVLAARFESPLLCYEWFKAGTGAFASTQSPVVAVLRTGATIDAIAPLANVKVAGLAKMEITGASFLREPTGLIYKNEESLRRLLEEVMKLHRPMVFHRLGLDSPESILIQTMSGEHNIVKMARQSATPWIPINSGWEEFERSISSSRRSSLRRARRKADDLGLVTFDICSPCLPEVGSLLEEIFAVEAAGWKGREGTAMKVRSSLKTFFTQYTQALAKQGRARLCFMRLDGRAIAVLLGVEYANRFWVLKIGYDERWASCSPGILLMHEVIRWSFGQHHKAFEFLGSNESWLHMWTDHVHTYETQWMYPMTPSGLFWLSVDMPNILVAKLVSTRARLRKRWHGKLFPQLRHAS
ncbi:MAG TPA: GNAT family N-acetyltransferase [Bacteroidota bacterium]